MSSPTTPAAAQASSVPVASAVPQAQESLAPRSLPSGPAPSAAVPGSGRDAAVTGDDMRRVMGHFCSGLVVITALGPDGPLGFTCQSFASLSLDPPLVSFSPARTSTTWPRIRQAASLCVNVLAEDQESHGRGFGRSGADKFAAVPWTPAPSGAPVLDGAAAWADCVLWAEYDGGDHTLVVAEVRALACDDSRRPLVFYRGAYGLPPAPLA
ncbi:flavin reductase family protein [Actinacidiphila acididurans]|uniref:Flavin reductase n=1 Tax=Actinacidiphila acididurans TaxID=2784346 RepID=A0ABS2U3A0_9ACTN|nr:flavin reductase family protein [Actinacidiphila acididurans]MBM9510066.1 flavin reductase [Actinacidiphila acididurans]